MSPSMAPRSTMITGSDSGNIRVHIEQAPGLLGEMGLQRVEINKQVSYMSRQALEETCIYLGAGRHTTAT